jgi:SOS-response transcriptional repressor LexA
VTQESATATGDEPTPRQQHVLDTLVGWFRRTLHWPSYRDLCAVLGIRSPNGVVSHLRALQKKGLIVRGSRGSGKKDAFRPTNAALAQHCQVRAQDGAVLFWRPLPPERLTPEQARALARQLTRAAHQAEED